MTMHSNNITRKRILRPALLLKTMIIWLLPGSQSALAVQSHGSTEGLISHEIGHILYFGGMIFMLAYIISTRKHSTAWIQFRRFLYLILLWNTLTFSGHYLREIISDDSFVKVGDRVVSITVTSFGTAVFYLAQLDHLILIPALLFLYLALKQWRADP